MPSPSEPDRDLSDHAAVEFLADFVTDRQVGREQPLAEYLQRFPRHEARIAAEWLAVHGQPSAATRPDAEASGRLADYELRRELGRGGQGIVYLAHDRRLGRDVALKVMRGGLPALQHAQALRFSREAEALARVDHANVCTVFDVGGDDQNRWLAMKLVDGPSLEQRLQAMRAEGRLPRGPAIDAALVLVEQLARGLHGAHAAGLVHRDIKPSNVLVGANETPVLVDFGLARADDGGVTMPGLVPGTASYLAPELLRGEPADVRSDLWSLGACLYELLALQRPYVAATVAAEVQARSTQAIVDVRRHNPAVPRDLAIVVATAVAVEPVRRYASALAFAEDLARCRRREPIAARRPSTGLVLQRWLQRNPVAGSSLLLAAVVMVVALVVTVLLLRDTRAALDDVTRLSDSRTCAGLSVRAGELFPLRAERIAGPDGIDAWLAAADHVLGRRALHEAALQRLQRATADGSAPWQVEQLTGLLATLDELRTRRARVAADRAFAEAVHERSVVAPAAAWAKARAAIAADPRFMGLDLPPQPGLVPLGADPRSGLQEFAHLQSGTVPGRDAATGALRRDADTGIVLVLVPGGSSVLGSESAARDGANVDPGALAGEGPCYAVDLAPFLLAKYEVTQAQWLRLVGTNPSNYSTGSELQAIDVRHPVEQVTWEAAARAMRQWDLCLPTEAQWEHAYRAGTRTPVPYGPDVQSLQGHENLADADAKAVNSYINWKFAEWLRDGYTVHAPVGTFAPNAWGLHDLGGNVREWCEDSWEAYEEVPPRTADGYRSGRFDKYRVLRGGAFLSDVSNARAGYRYGMPIGVRAPDAGVRAARRLER